MAEFWHRFTTSRVWFIGTIMVVFFLFVFIYWLFNPQGLINAVNGYSHVLWQIIIALSILAIACLGIAIVWGYRPWWMGGRKKSGGH